MKFFIDTAEIEEIERANSLGILDGITTNPTLFFRAGLEFNDENIKKVCALVDGPVSIEVASLEEAAMASDEMIEQARHFAGLAKNVVVKIPVTEEGLKAIKVLSGEGINVNVTLCFSATQALLAAKAGGAYISPFIGRLDERAPGSGMKLVHHIKTIYDNYGFKTEIIVASIRSVQHVRDAALTGAHIATIPPKIFSELLAHPMTNEGLDRFFKDFRKLHGLE